MQYGALFSLAVRQRSPKPASPLPFDSNFDEIRPVRRNSTRQGWCDGVSLLDPDAFDAHAGRQIHEIKIGCGQIHVLIGMLRPGFKVLTSDVHIVLENAIFPVREDDEHNRKLVVSRSPQCLDAVHR